MQRTRTAWAGFALVVVCGALAVVASAVGGPWTISDRGGFWSPKPMPLPTRPPESAGPSSAPTLPPIASGEPARWLAWALWIAVALIVSLLLVLIWRKVAQWVRERQETEQVETETTGEVYPDAPTIRAGLTSAMDELTVTVNPTDAVLRAWVALEGAAGRSGVPRKPSDTPTEFTGRVLAATSADRTAVDELLQLYHQARFSWHGLGGLDRERARTCLEGLSASWSTFETPTTETDPGPTGRGPEQRS